MKEVYILATAQAAPVPLQTLREALEGEEVEVTVEEGEYQLTIASGEARTQVRFESLEGPLGWAPDFLSGSEDAQRMLQQAQGFYRIGFETARPHASVAVFEALWCARAVMELVEQGVLLDVTAYKLHEPEDVREITELEFDIRDHVNLHAVAVEDGQNPLWVHSHGMEKFGTRDVEVFQLAEEDLPAAESFLHQLCTDLAFGHGPPLRAPVDAGEDSFMLLPSEEARASLMGVGLEAFDGHEGMFLTVLSASGRHNLTRLLAPYRDHFEEEPPERTEALRRQAAALLPAFKARFGRKGLMEPLAFRVRSRFASHPDGEAVEEDLWVEVQAWEGGTVVGKLVDGGAHTTEWRKGAQVRVEEGEINALALAQEGRVVEGDDLGQALSAERPM